MRYNWSFSHLLSLLISSIPGSSTWLCVGPGKMSCEIDLRSKPSCRQGHLDCGLAHSLKGFPTCFCRWTLVCQIAQDGCRSKDGKVYFIGRLQKYHELMCLPCESLVTYQSTSNKRRMPDCVQKRNPYTYLVTIYGILEEVNLPAIKIWCVAKYV